MASYTFTAAGIYDPTTGAKIGGNLPGNTLNDGSPADFFTTAGPGSSFSVGGITVNYTGTVTAGGNTFPAGTIVGGPQDGNNILFVESSPLPPALPPATITDGNFATCFAAGTEIATPEGVKLVEALEIGDMVRTLDGRDVEVKWIGRQTVSARFNPAERVLPVKFAAGSLGGELPTKDLVVTADHAMLLGDTLCNAAALVNGTTITRVPVEEMGETFTVYHVETAEHEVILANGAAAETFIDNVSRRVFDNFAEFDALYGDVAEMKELGYPRAMSARQVPAAIKAMIASEKVA